MKLTFFRFAALHLAAAFLSVYLETLRSMPDVLGVSDGSTDFSSPIDSDSIKGSSVIKSKYGPYKVPANSAANLFLMDMKKIVRESPDHYIQDRQNTPKQSSLR
jgi:hypothetical protein